MQIDSEAPKTVHQQDPHLAIPPFSSFPSYYDSYPVSREEEVNLLDYGRLIWRHRFKIILFTLMVTLLTYVYSLTIPKKYQAEATIAPVLASSGGGFSALLNQARALPLIGGQLGGLTQNTQQTAQFKNILTSRVLIGGVIQDLHLMPVLFRDQWDVTKNNWRSNDANQIPQIEDGAEMMRGGILKVEDDPGSGLLKIQVRYTDPQLVANIANHFVVRLQDYITNNGLTVAKRNRIFVEGQLQKNKIHLLELSKKLSQFYTVNQVSSVQSKLDVDVGKLESLPKTFEEFRRDLKEVEEKKKTVADVLTETEQSGIVKNVPAQVYLQYLTLQRELLGQANALLLQQYELSKIEESKEDLAFQVIDKAITPRGSFYPNIRLNAQIAFVGGLFLSIFLVFFYEYIQKMREKEKNRALK